MDPRLHEIALQTKGFLDDAEGLRLCALAEQACKVGPVLEVGSYCGKSSVYLGAGVQAGGGTLICVDHHRGSEEHQKGEGYHDPELYDADAQKMDTLLALRRTVRLAGLEDVTILAVGKSTAVASVWSKPLGMVFIDGGHSFETALSDYAGWANKVAPGGILAIHDLFPNPDEGGQAPITIYRKGVESGMFEALATTKTLGVLRRKSV